jgi:hypothetical protein
MFLIIAVWFFFFKSSSSVQNPPADAGFGIGDNRTVTVPLSSDSATANGTVPLAQQTTQQKIFEVTDQPVTGATLIQTSNPTTTIARYVLQENGHVFDLTLDNAGAVPRAVSNTTIPGTATAAWTESGMGVVLQYLDGAVIKSVHLGLPPPSTATTSAVGAVHIQFLPDNSESIAASPDGKSIAYLLPDGTGTDAYVSHPDGTNGKLLFSLPLSQILLSWPAQSTLLAATKSASGYPGIVFSVSAASGNVSTLLAASGVTATADPSFSRVVYKPESSSDGTATTYVHTVKTGQESALSFNPIPEKCIWSTATSTLMYCAAPLQYVPADYLDLWHQGAATLPDSIISFDVSTNRSTILATPGSDGGVASDIASLAVSPDGHYLLFVKKGDRSLWAVRLAQ